MYRGTQIDELQRQLATIEQRLKNLEVRQHPALFKSTTCTKCGVIWKGTMGYCCPNSDCPMGAGPTTC